MKVIISLILLMMVSGCSYAYTLDQWADAIKHAENSHKHPYGIMIKCKNPRMVCKRTVWHRWCIYRKLGLKTPFVAFLQASYAPLHVNNDPKNLNINWIHNVSYWIEKG